ncbi:MAG: OmpH family outer membrane protein [Paramuribaculum sp.]|nr:OmpH family outer membrane protein [Paramuribaculum sp.]
MKKTFLVAKALIVIVAAVAVSCSSGNSTDKNVVSGTNCVKSDSAACTLSIRYINEDSIISQYYLAKDIKEASIKAMSKLESAQNSRAAEIQRFGSQIEEKMRSNGYLSEQSYQADVAKFQKMQQDAQTYLATLQRNVEMEMAQGQIQVTDSIQSFIKRYNETHHYDAILLRSAGVYFNPALDITDEVIEGLNAAYNKVEK